MKKLDKSELLKELRIERDAPEDGAPSRLRLWLALGAAAVVLVALLAWFFNREKPVEVTVATARPMPAASAGTSVLDATGYVTARRQATVSAKITGKVRDVRIEAAALLAGMPIDGLSPAERSAFDRASAEYAAVQAFLADRPESRVNLGTFLAQRGNTDAASRRA